MKKSIILTLALLFVLTFSSAAFASNGVSQMTTTTGGLSVAECAKAMLKGVSECAQMPVCDQMAE